MTLGVVLNLSHAKTLAGSGEKAQRILSFCPTATYFLREQGYMVDSTYEIYGAQEHGEVVQYVAREQKLLTDAARSQYGLNDVEAEGLSVYLYHYLCCAYHLYFCLRGLRSQDALLWVDEGKVKRGSYEAMFSSLATQPSRVILAYAYTGYSVPHAMLAGFYNRVVFALAGCSKRLKVMDYGDELSKRIINALIAEGEKPLVFNTHTVCKRAYKTTRFFIKSLARLASGKAGGKPVYVFRSTMPSRYHEKVQPFAVSGLVSSEVQAVVKTMVESFIPFTRAEVAIGRELVRGLKPEIAVSDHAKYAYILSGLEEMSRYGGQHAMLNHGTHTMQYEPISALAARQWGAQQRIISQHTTHSLPKSPLTAALAREIRPGNDYRQCRLNVYGRIPNNASPDGKFMILQAGNYTDAYNHIPWCKETADEYLLAIIELIEEAGKLDNVELIIKLKNKKADTHKKIVEEHIARLGVADKVRVDTTSRFSDLMSKAHLVVCNLSGTIEEALANHIPVMVHTYRKSYFHIPEEAVKPASKGTLAAAYLVKERADIARYVTALDAMRGQLNDPELFRDVTWGESQMPIGEFATMLAADARKKVRP